MKISLTKKDAEKFREKQKRKVVDFIDSLTDREIERIFNDGDEYEFRINGGIEFLK